MVFRTREAGILRVARDGEEGYRMTLPAYGPEPRPLPDLVKAVGGTPAETLWHPGRYAPPVYASAADVRALAPAMAALRALGRSAERRVGKGGVRTCRAGRLRDH